MPIYSELRPMTEDERTTVAGLAIELQRQRPWKVRREPDWGWAMLLAAVFGVFGLWNTSWLIGGVVNIVTRRQSATPPWIANTIALVLLLIAFRGAFQGSQWLWRLWMQRNPLSAAALRATAAHEIHQFHVEAVGVVLATSRTGDDEPYYLFDLGDASALLLHGHEFGRSSTFPNRVFDYARAPRGGPVVFRVDSGERLVPTVSGGYRVQAQYLDSHDLVLEGPFEEVCERVLERVAAA